MTDDLPLHAMAPTERFSDRAEDYARFRPDYPAAAIDHVLAGLGDPHALAAADIGAGTGISTRQLAARGVRVIAVEPNAEMRAAAEPHPRVTWQDGVGEATGLPDACVDLVLSAQAFHWFRQDEAVAELRRILRPRGRLALVWNSRDRGDPLTLDYVDALHRAHGEHAVERRAFGPAVVGAGGFTDPERAEFPHAQSLDRAGLHGRALSASYIPKGGAAHAEMDRRLDALFDEHQVDGVVTMRYRTEVWIAKRL